MRAPLLALLLVPALALSGGPAVAQADEELPPGCEADGATYRCSWDVSTSDDPQRNADDLLVPTFPRTVATVVVSFSGVDRGHRLSFYRENETEIRLTSQTYRLSDAPSSSSYRVENVFLLVARPEDVYHLIITYSAQRTPDGGAVYGVAGPSVGEFQILYIAQPVPEGETPTRSAATREDPHLADISGDATREDADIVAVWLDDARLGDGLMEAHIGARDLARWAPGQRTPPGALAFNVTWEVEGQTYFLHVILVGTETGYDLTCRIQRADDRLSDYGAACDVDADNATLDAQFLEMFVGHPSPGAPFRELYAKSSLTLGSQVRADEATGTRYEFALGGPEVWSALNPRLDPVETRPLAWYQDPLANENLPDTLSVAGALLATATFLAGLVVVQRNRRRTRDILDRIDHLVRLHERDTQAALRELGALEAEFDGLYRKGRINESQYQLAQQRIVAAASRLALRKELGLDDGTPG